MRILQTIAPARFGGMEEVVVRLAGGLTDRGHEVVVAPVYAGTPGPHPFLDALRGRGVEVEACFLPPRAYRREVTAIRQILEGRSMDVLHTHGYRPAVIHSRAVRGTERGVVTTFHGFTGGGWKNRLYERLHVRASRSMDATIAVSQPMAERLRAQGVPESRLHLLPNAWEPPPEPLGPEEGRATLGVEPGRFHIGWVGRLGPEKGPDVFLKALALLPGMDAIVSILGDGRLREGLIQRSNHVVAPDVRFHGTVPNAGRLFTAFDLFVLSSRTEGTPMVLFEAMAARVPVIATAVGGVPNVLDEQVAILVPPEDPGALAEAIKDVRGNPEAAVARAGRAYERLHQRFSAAPWIAHHESLYSSILHRSEVHRSHPES